MLHNINETKIMKNKSAHTLINTEDHQIEEADKDKEGERQRDDKSRITNAKEAFIHLHKIYPETTHKDQKQTETFFNTPVKLYYFIAQRH